MMDVYEIGNISYIPEAAAIIAQTSSREIFTEPLSPINFDKYKLAPWGDDNLLPDNVKGFIDASEIVSSNILFKIRMCYGQGVKPMKKTIENKIVYLEDSTDEKVLNFFTDNNIARYFLEQSTDMMTFFNTFPELILTKDLKQVYSLRHKEATFSRWGISNKKTGEIEKHFYSSNWGLVPTLENTVVSEVLSRFNPYQDLTNRVTKKISEPRFMMQVNFPTPGNVYYQQAYWWSIFKSGWYDYTCMIPKFKTSLIKNGLAVKYIIYISDDYWKLIFKNENIDTNNVEAVKNRKNEEYTKFKNFLNDENNQGKGMVLPKRMTITGNSAIEEKLITIEVVKADIKGGEYLEDSAEASNMISYGMAVPPNIVSATGKNSSSLSGTDKREIYNIESALSQPFREMLLEPLRVIKRFNKWPVDTEFVVQDYQFTTTDVNKSGKQTNTDPNANK